MGKFKRLFRHTRQEKQQHRFLISVDCVELKNDSNIQVAYELERNSRVITSREQAQLRNGRAHFKNPLVVDLTLYCKKNKQFGKKTYSFVFYEISRNEAVVVGKTQIDFSQFVPTSRELCNVAFVCYASLAILKGSLNCGTAHLTVRCGTMGGGAHDITAELVEIGEQFHPTRSCSLPQSGRTNGDSEDDSDGGVSGSMDESILSSEETNGGNTWADSSTNSEEAHNWSGNGHKYDRPVCSRDNTIAALKRSINSSLQKLARLNGPRWAHCAHGAGETAATNATDATVQVKPSRGAPGTHTSGEKKATLSGTPPRRGKNKKDANHPTLEVQSVIRNMEKAIKNGEVIRSMNRSLFQQSGEEGVTEGGNTQRSTQVETRRYDAVSKLKERPNGNGVNSTGGEAECRSRAEQNGQSSHPSNYNMGFVTEEKNCQDGGLSKTNWSLGSNLAHLSGERDNHFEPSMVALRQLLLIREQSAHEWDGYHHVGSYATPLRPPHDGCTVSRTREEVYTKGLPCWGGRNCNNAALNGVHASDHISTHFASRQLPIGAPTNGECPHSYAMREDENFLLRSVNGRGPKGGEMENLLTPLGGGFSQAVDHTWRGVTKEGIHTRGTNLGGDFALNVVPNRLQGEQFASQHGYLFKKNLSEEGATPPHGDHPDVHSNERTNAHSKIKKISSEENKSINELVTIRKLVEEMQNVQLVIKELAGTSVGGGHRGGASNHGDPNATEEAHSEGKNTTPLCAPSPHGEPNKESATHDGNASVHCLSRGDAEKYEEKIANLVQELMNTKLLLAQSETKREEEINEMKRRCGS
ncbi:N-terminal C2 in EEIG1 and EHBP1 proteins, putative [Plasmodium vivax]|uniref:C2 NT-type domain-containing protein n=3 Tax=Plasmodium vivax TaxID=5855 RepID=A0A0J9WER2_PLAVI|nr:hypothetical protein PVIIG_02953 [Plasmodium vivax India VII]KNA01104.1 hypothetical protein PVNG_02557 [Plasmodium vivax North Korean]CAG9479896.1 unnamed protein product [Plasmodium vivax]SCO71383.1 N-terminal C2 in EEIG1 and EHBP1 proteins, putative [Plasmodium vivax]